MLSSLISPAACQPRKADLRQNSPLLNSRWNPYEQKLSLVFQNDAPRKEGRRRASEVAKMSMAQVMRKQCLVTMTQRSVPSRRAEWYAFRFFSLSYKTRLAL